MGFEKEEILKLSMSDGEIAYVTRQYLRAEALLKKLDLDAFEWVIYPYGRNGKIVAEALSRLGKKPALILDEVLCEAEDNVFPLRTLKEREFGDYRVLLCCDQRAIDVEVREALLRYVPFDFIVDVFSPSPYFAQGDFYYQATSFQKEIGQYPRIRAAELAAREIYQNQVQGCVAEAGVFRGYFAGYLSRLFPERKLYLFDTFKGFDDRDVDEQEEQWSGLFRAKSDYSDTSAEYVASQMLYQSRLVMCQGYFPETAGLADEEQFAFVSLDTDLYKPIKAGLDFFWQRLSPGGYIFVDDLGHGRLRGVREAVLAFCKEQRIGYVSIDDGTDATAVFAKPLY